jgi:predicted GIY-YIG superfamily endonuclease
MSAADRQDEFWNTPWRDAISEESFASPEHHRAIPHIRATAYWDGRFRDWLLRVTRCPFCSGLEHLHRTWAPALDTCVERWSPCVDDEGRSRGMYALVPDHMHSAPAPATPPPMPDQPQWLYRLFDSEGRLIYIGVSDSVWRRVKEHERDQAWGPDIAQVRRQRYPGRAAVLAAEKRAIQIEKPVHNIVHNAGDPC